MFKKAFKFESLMETIITCPKCQQKNCLSKRVDQGVHKCGDCQSQLSDLLISLTSQTQIASKGGKVVGFSILVSIGLLIFLGRSVLADSQSLPMSSILLTSQLKTVPNLPIKIALNRSLPENTVLVSPATEGGGSLQVSNGTNHDAYIKLVEPRSGTLVAAFYVKLNSSFTLEQIPDGTYEVLFVLGEDWDSKAQSFTKSKSFTKFDKSLNFTTMQLSNEIHYRAFRITLNPVSEGNTTTSRVSEKDFERY